METTQKFPLTQQTDPNDARTHYAGRELQLFGQQQPQFYGETTYKSTMTQHPMETRGPLQPPGQYPTSRAPFEGTPTYRADYPGHAVGPRSPPPAHQWSPNPAPFHGTTTHRDAFVAHAMEPRGPHGPPPMPQTAPFAGTSSYRQDFPGHAVEPRSPPQPHQFSPNKAAFDATTSYGTSYPAHPLEPRGPILPHHAPPSNAPFQGQTHYRDDFKAHTIEPRAPHQAPAYQPNPAPFQGATEMRDSFPAWPTEPKQALGPPPMRPSVPFDGTTTSREAFKGWKLPARRPALGVQMVGDKTYVLIPAEAPLPAMGRQVFTTVHDNQSDMCILVLRGDAPIASRNPVIGQFDLRGLPPGPRASAKVEVTFLLDQDSVLTATARILDDAGQEQWLQHGSMEARAVGTHSDVQSL